MKLEKVYDSKGRQIENLYRDPVSGSLIVRKKRKGKKPLYVTLGVVSLTVAKAMRDRLIAEWIGDDKPIELQGAKRLNKFSEVWEKQYVPSKIAATNSENTKRSLTVAGNTYLLPQFGEMYVQEIAENGEALWEQFYSQYPLETSLYNAQKYMNNFMRYCYETLRILPRKPVIKLPPERARKTKKYKKQNRLVSRRDRVMLARTAGAGTDMRHLILGGYRQGNRISEITGLRWNYLDKYGHKNWVEFKSNGAVLIHLNETKTGIARHIYADPIFARVLKKRHQSKISDWVFPLPTNPAKCKRRQNFDTEWTKARKAVGVECVFHDLRHSFLTDKFKQPDIPHILVCEYAGLSLKEAQETYLHFDHEDTRVVIKRAGVQK